MSEEVRTREKQIKFRVTEHELDVIRQRKEMMNYKSMEQYLRRVALGSPLYKLDLTSVDQVTEDVAGISRNINQIAKRINSTDTAYAEDLRQIRARQDELMELLKKAFGVLLKLKE